MISLEPVYQFLNSYFERQFYPGAACGIIHKDEVSFITCGVLDPRKPEEKVRSDTLYDIASITKPVATATAILQLMDQNQVDLNAPVADYLIEFKNSRSFPAITVKHLLTHSSGLPGWLPLYIYCNAPDSCFEYIASLESDYPTGSKVVYSCLGFILLAEIVRRITKQTLSDYCRQHIFSPLGMSATRFNPTEEQKYLIAPTELGNEYERYLAGHDRRTYSGWRRYRLRGEVQDGNAYFLNGEGGNAGLFSSVADLLKFCRCMMNNGNLADHQLLRENTIQRAVQSETPGLDFQRGLGWLMADSSLSAGSKFSSQAFGHNGFSGTSLWIDPGYDLAVVLLTNRSYYGGNGHSFGKIRAPFNELVVSSILKQA